MQKLKAQVKTAVESVKKRGVFRTSSALIVAVLAALILVPSERLGGAAAMLMRGCMAITIYYGAVRLLVHSRTDQLPVEVRWQREHYLVIGAGLALLGAFSGAFG